MRKKYFFVFVTNDSVTIKSEDKNSSCYYNPSVFKPADFTLWLSAKYADKFSAECASRLAGQVNDELMFEKRSENKIWSNTKTNSSNLVHLQKKTSSINPVYAKDSMRIEKIKITLTRDNAPTASDTDHISFIVDNKSFPYKPVVFPSSITIMPLDWKSDGYNITLDTVIYLKNLHTDVLSQDANAYLQIDGDKSFHTIRLTESGMYSPVPPFWIELGSNFDLLDGIDPNNFYSGIYMFDQDAVITKHHGSISFTAGVYEAKSGSNSLSSDSGFTYRDATTYKYDSAHKGFPYYRNSGPLTTVTSVKNIGLFFSPYFRLNNKPVKQNGFHWFISVYAEMLWQKVVTTVDYSKTKLDTTMYLPASNSRDTSIYNLPFKESHYTSDFRSHYLGIGLPIYIKEANYNFFLNTVFGVSTQRFILTQSSSVDPKKYHVDTYPNGKPNNGILPGYAMPKHLFNPFYLIQFKLNEDKYGVTVTGEIRGLIFLPGAKPVVLLSISKKFDLGELFTSIVKPFSLGK